MGTEQAAQPRLSDQLTDVIIRRLVGPDAYHRGAAYARSGRVLEVRFDEKEQALAAAVSGSQGRRYATSVSLDPDDDYVTAYCTCPVGIDCKHAAATMIAARTILSGAPGGVAATTGGWERALSPVLQGQAAPADASSTPLALQFELVALPQPRYAPTPPTQPRIRLRPVVRGKNGRWVRTGVSWSDLQYDYVRSASYSAAQRGVLRELYGAHRNGSGAHLYGVDGVYFDEFGPSIWRLLDQATSVGVELVPAAASDGPVVLSPDKATVSLDLIRSAPDSAVTLAPRVEVGGLLLAAGSVTYLGKPEHGIFARQGAAGLLLAALDQPLDQHVAPMVRANDQLRVPPEDVERFLSDYYPSLRRAISVGSSDGSVVLPEVAPPRLALGVTYEEDNRVGLEWNFRYAIGDKERRLPLVGPAPAGVRDAAAERRLLAGLDLPDDRLPMLRVPTGTGQLRPVPALTLAGMDAVLFTAQVLPALQADDAVVVEECGARPEFRQLASSPLVTLSAEDSAHDPDWFDLGIRVSIDGEEVPFGNLFTALARGDTHLVLASGSYFRIDRPDLDQLRRLIEEARSLTDQPPSGLRISPYQAGLWQELCALGVVDAQSQRWATTIEGLVGVDEIDPPAEPAGLCADLRPYQRDGYRWLSFLWDHGLGGILADDMGLGKTVQALALICRAFEEGRLDAPVLVVAPASVVPNWAREAQRFAPGLNVVTVTETEARQGGPLSQRAAAAQIVVTSYALFRIDYEAYAAQTWSGLVLDEAQFVKNSQAKTYSCARRLPAPFKLAITGTPLENSLMDLWSLLSIVAPGLFPSPQRFAEFYRKPIERGTDPARLATLRNRIRPLMRRRTKEQVAAELPPKTEQVLEVTLQPRHQKIYQTHLQRERQKILGLLGDLDRNRFTILRSLTLLRQLSLDPSLVDAQYANVRSSKVDAFLEQLTEVVQEGHRALVFSQFTGFLRRIRERLDVENIGYCYLDGRTRNRARVIDAFKTGDAPVFLISLKAGGFGLNLTEADYCFVLDPWWNPAVEAQAVDRAHRIGQDRSVVVYRLVAAGTIEEKVMELKERKAQLFNRVMEDDALLSAPLSVDDIRALLEPSG